MSRDGRYAGLEAAPQTPAWWRNGLGWCLFVLGPGIGVICTLAVMSLVEAWT